MREMKEWKENRKRRNKVISEEKKGRIKEERRKER